jgi:hypothetical protein
MNDDDPFDGFDALGPDVPDDDEEEFLGFLAGDCAADADLLGFFGF